MLNPTHNQAPELMDIISKYEADHGEKIERYIRVKKKSELKAAQAETTAGTDSSESAQVSQDAIDRAWQDYVDEMAKEVEDELIEEGYEWPKVEA